MREGDHIEAVIEYEADWHSADKVTGFVNRIGKNALWIEPYDSDTGFKLYEDGRIMELCKNGRVGQVAELGV